MHTKFLPNLYLSSPKLNHLNILGEIAGNSRVTQAELATRCTLSVAMVNNYMKELCGAGLIEYRRKSIKNVTYHLTALGAHYFGDLQAKLIDEMARMHIEAKERIRKLVIDRVPQTLQRVIIYGSGHLAQLVYHALASTEVKILGICDDDIETIGSDFWGRQVVSPSQINFLAPDAVIIADSSRTEQICQSLASLADSGITIIRLDCYDDRQILQNSKFESAQPELQPSLH